HFSLSPSTPRPLRSTLFPYTTLFRSRRIRGIDLAIDGRIGKSLRQKIGSAIDGRLNLLLSHIDVQVQIKLERDHRAPEGTGGGRSEEHTSELQSRFDLVCRLLLEKKK